MPLAENALTTLDALKAYLKIGDHQFWDDGILEDLINACSGIIEQYCRRKFRARQHEEEHDGTGTRYLNLQQFPVQHIDSIHIDGELVTVEEYVIKKNSGIVARKNGVWPSGDVNITVIYTAGFSEIPYELELACKHLAMSYFKSDVASFSTTFQEGFVFRPEALPAQVRTILQPYKKVV